MALRALGINDVNGNRYDLCERLADTVEVSACWMCVSVPLSVASNVPKPIPANFSAHF